MQITFKDWNYLLQYKYVNKKKERANYRKNCGRKER